MTLIDLPDVQYSITMEDDTFRAVERDVEPEKVYLDRDADSMIFAVEREGAYAAIDLTNEAAKQLADRINEVLE